MKEQLGRLVRADLRDYWKDEAKDFTPWLAMDENIELLGEAIGVDLEVQEREAKVGTFSADILCKDIQTDRYVVIENQLEKTDHGHLGQLITYCSGLSAYTAIWIAKTFDEEHRSAIDWLNDITDDNYNFFAIEVHLYRIGDSALAPQFNVVAKPNGWSKAVRKQIADKGENETQLLRTEFWTAFLSYLENKKLEGIRVGKASDAHWIDFYVGMGGFHYSCVITLKNWIAVQPYFHGDNVAASKKRFDLIEKECKEAISQISSLTVEWNRLDDKKASYINVKRVGDIRDKDNWPTLFDWLYNTLTQLHSIMKPYYHKIREIK